MTEKEYDKKIELAKTEYEKTIRETAKEFAFSNKKASIEDIVSNRSWTIKVDEIRFSYRFYEKPQCVYYGQMLTKKGEIRKNKVRKHVFDRTIENITKGNNDEN